MIIWPPAAEIVDPTLSGVLDLQDAGTQLPTLLVHACIGPKIVYNGLEVPKVVSVMLLYVLFISFSM